MKTYPECIDWLFQQFPAYQKIGATAYKPDLGNILYLCSFLNIDYSSLKFIHIAGTNGKGSVSNFMASILMESGLNTGLFTSPHIKDFRERIRVNGIEIPEERVVSFCQKITESSMDIQPSFFEITWALSLLYFIEQQCDICVIETGLGGRLDATNIITPVLSVITNIGLDHTAILGNTYEQIAREKAGIIKEGIPTVIGEILPETRPVFEKQGAAVSSHLYYADKQAFDMPFYFPESCYQYLNERTVRTAVNVLNTLSFHITEENILQGISKVADNTGFRARFQKIKDEPLCIVDVAHNVEGISQLLKSIQPFLKGKLKVVYGTSSDKDFATILSLFPPDTEFFFTEFSNERSATLAQLGLAADQLHLRASFFQHVEKAFETAQQTANKQDTILITGSFFLINDFF